MAIGSSGAETGLVMLSPEQIAEIAGIVEKAANQALEAVIASQEAASEPSPEIPAEPKPQAPAAEPIPDDIMKRARAAVLEEIEPMLKEFMPDGFDPARELAFVVTLPDGTREYRKAASVAPAPEKPSGAPLPRQTATASVPGKSRNGYRSDGSPMIKLGKFEGSE